MMQAKDLRIGNLVNVPNKTQCPFRIDGFEYLNKDDGKVEMSTIPNCHPWTWWIKDLTPIEITENWLLKLGFIKSEYCFGLITSEGKLRLTIFKDGHFKIGTEDIPINIKYVHELQNICYLLTGEELTVKL